ncbi:MAG: uracil-DNA glycosylase [Nanoarchaeota archaeon]|nr:uracil-DNA glycosylase [Nanoarchaeota archaeon]
MDDDTKSNKKSLEFNFLEAAMVKRTELFKDCINIVVGRGNPNAKILFVGESPGRNEDIAGEAFVGAAGKNLDKLLAKVGLSIEDIYIANILKCRPPENRDPTSDEIRAHSPWLLKQIRDMQPRVVCSLGNYATKFFMARGNVDLMNKQEGITKLHGSVVDITMEGITFKLIPLFHPAAIIYNRKIEPLWTEDMEIVKREINL